MIAILTGILRVTRAWYHVVVELKTIAAVAACHRGVPALSRKRILASFDSIPIRTRGCLRSMLWVIGSASLFGCDSATPVASESGYRISIVSGDGQVAGSGAELPLPLKVRVAGEDGAGVAGVRVRFAVVGGSGSGRLVDSVGVTGFDGMTGVRAAVGDLGDTLRVDATIAVVPHVRGRFSAVAIQGPMVSAVTPTDVRAGDTVSVSGSLLGGMGALVRFGDAAAGPLAGATDSQIRVIVPACLAAGTVTLTVESGRARSAGRDVSYADRRITIPLQPLDFVTIPASQLAGCVELPGDGATYLLAGQFASAPIGVPVLHPWRLGVAGTSAGSARADAQARRLLRPLLRDAQHAFDTYARRVERSVAAQARAERRTSALAMAQLGEAPVVGSVRTFSVVAATDGSSFSSVGARLRYVGEHVMLYTDTSATGYTLNQLQSLVSLFDGHLWGEAVNAFGAAPDVDGNGRVIVLFTPAVNALTPAADCVQRGYVTGFFYPIDQLERARGSNRAEIFYAIVPDPAATFSCPHTEAEAVRQVQGAFLHEMQHLISFNEHVLARGEAAEDTWLNEGLSHLAEELGSRYFESRYPAPLGRSTSTQLYPDSAGPFIGPLLLNAYLYLNNSVQHSVTAYEGTGSIEERGATWLFLRWLADQKGDDITRRLVQTSRTGIANVEAASEERFPSLFGDFSLALFADSLPGVARAAVPARLRFGNRSLRLIMAREAVVAGFSDPFPLATFSAPPGEALRASMPVGTMIHAIIPGDQAPGPVRLSFSTPELAPFQAQLGAQVSIMRLPP